MAVRPESTAPSTVGDNWEWRVKEEQLDEELKETIQTLTKKYRAKAEERAAKERKEREQKKLEEEAKAEE